MFPLFFYFLPNYCELEFMENYLPILKEYRDRGELSAEAVALMEDRVLILNGLPQLYGSQINNDSNGNPTLLEYEGTLCDVNNRRDKIGMIPVEDYVARFGIELEVNCN